MIQYGNYDKTEAYSGDYEKLSAGGYVCVILKVVVEEKDYGHLMRIAFDIADGEHEGFYERQFKRKQQNNQNAKWPGMYYQTIKEDDLKYFKGFMQAVEQSNPGYQWDWDEKKLVSKLFGGVFGEEEYMGNDGNIRTSVKCMFVNTVAKIKEGVKVPEIKKLQNNSSSTTSFDSFAREVSLDDDIPF